MTPVIVLMISANANTVSGELNEGTDSPDLNYIKAPITLSDDMFSDGDYQLWCLNDANI